MRLPVMLFAGAALAAILTPDLVQRLEKVDVAPAEAAVPSGDPGLRRSPGARLGDEVFEADAGGHYRIEARAAGQRIAMMADTGATVVALRLSDARRIGLRPAPADFDQPLSTANGVVKGARVVIPELQVGTIRVSRVEAVVLPDEVLGTNLLGMSFLKRLSRFEVAANRLVLTP